MVVRLFPNWSRSLSIEKRRELKFERLARNKANWDSRTFAEKSSRSFSNWYLLASVSSAPNLTNFACKLFFLARISSKDPSAAVELITASN